MKKATSMSERRVTALRRLSVIVSEIGDNFSDTIAELPPLDLSELGEYREIREVRTLEQLAAFLELVNQKLLASQENQ